MPFYKINDPESAYFEQTGMWEDTAVFHGTLSMYYLRMSNNMVVGFLAHQIDAVKPKVLFLDIDGVCNSADYMTSGRHVKGTMLGIDPFPAVLVKMIVQDTGCLVVLSSTWRLNAKSREDVRNEVVGFIDITNDMYGKDRGFEIEEWLNRHPEVEKYAILDDDMDMLAYQAPNFFKTRWQTGLTREIAKAVTEHLNDTSAQ